MGFITYAVNQFSGRDDNYNTIEGLFHGGSAEKKRREQTSFGSGWQGIEKEFLAGSRALGLKENGLIDRFMGGVDAQGYVLQKELGKSATGNDFAKYFAEQIKDHRSKFMVGVEYADGTRGPFELFKNPKVKKQTRSLFKRLRTIGEKPVLFINKDRHSNFHELKSTVAHEQVHAFTGGNWQASAAIAETQQFKEFSKYADESGTYPKPRHADEFLAFIRTKLLSKETYAAETDDGFRIPIESFIDQYKVTRFGNDNTLSFRDLMAGSLKPIIKESAPIEQVIKHEIRGTSHSNRYALLGIGALGVIGLAGYAFSGKDDVYNTIEGLKHGGMAQEKRMEMTPFGSGWDKLRQLAMDAGTTLEKFVRTPAFKESLGRGRFVRELGKGSFGHVNMMESVVKVGEKEHSFQYAAKTMFDPDFRSTFAEVKAQRKLQDLNAPNVYGWKGNTVFMEAFEGRRAGEVMRSGGQLPESFIQDMESFVPEMHKRGMVHRDIARDVSRYADKGPTHVGEYMPHNVIVTKEGRAGVIDYGTVTKPGLTDSSSGIYQKNSMGRTFHTTEDADMALVQSLRANEGKLSHTSLKLTGNKVGESPTIEKAATAATAATSKNTDKMRKLAMAASQQNTARAMSENARSGGHRSKSTFSNTRKGLGPNV